MKKTPYTTVRLSEEFSRIIADWLTPEELEEVNETNEHDDEYFCATHEHCDANEAMIQAWDKVFPMEPLDITTDKHVTIVNEAWAMSKKNQFKVGDSVSA